MKVNNINHLNLRSNFIQHQDLKPKVQSQFNQSNYILYSVSDISSKQQQKLNLISHISEFKSDKSQKHCSIQNQNDIQEDGGQLCGRWSSEQHQKFLIAHEHYPKDWKKIASIVKSRSASQVRSHAQKYFNRVQKDKAKNNYYGRLDEKMRLRERNKKRKYQQIEALSPNKNYNRKFKNNNKEKSNNCRQSQKDQKQIKFYGDSILQKYHNDLKQPFKTDLLYVQDGSKTKYSNKNCLHSPSSTSIPESLKFSSSILEPEGTHFFVPICNEKQLIVVEKSKYDQFAQITIERDPQESIFYEFVRQLHFIHNPNKNLDKDVKIQKEFWKEAEKKEQRTSIFNKEYNEYMKIKSPILTIISSNSLQSFKHTLIEQKKDGFRIFNESNQNMNFQ